VLPYRLLKPPPEPLSHGACVVVRARLGLSAAASGTVAFLRGPDLVGLGSLIEIGWKGTRIPGNEMLLAMKKAAI